MKLNELLIRLTDAHCEGECKVPISGVHHDSRAVRPGDLFVCLVGEKFDGHRFAADALARGAAALCARPARASDLPSAPTLIVPDTRRAMPEIAAAVYGDPSRSMKLVGVTGTNGKTTTTFLTASILRAAGLKAGTIGTLGAELMGEELPSERTTPEADQLQALFAEMLRRGAQAVAMEVSSHALAQYRTDGSAYDAAVFTNLTQDHLDYHGDMESYLQAKLRLFREYPQISGKPFVAAVNLDDAYGAQVAEATRGRVLGYGVRERADVQGRDVQLTPGSVRFVADTPAGRVNARLNIGGAFQVYNALGAIAVAVGLGIAPAAIEQGLASLPAVPGRFESVPTGRDFHVVVDYAHTPDGLENLLSSARRLDPKRLLIVFGCGGDRDRTKRPIMGKIAGERADVVVVTSDNPRTEDPAAIIQDILHGLQGVPARIVIEPDRRSAIGIALSEARPGDIVLVAGKGHEDYQEVNGVKHHFDDREVVRQILTGVS